MLDAAIENVKNKICTELWQQISSVVTFLKVKSNQGTHSESRDHQFFRQPLIANASFGKIIDDASQL